MEGHFTTRDAVGSPRLPTDDAGDATMPASDDGLVLVRDVRPHAVEWLWPGRVAIGKLTLLAGDPGVGKSYITLDIAARVSRGGPWPGEGKAEGGGGKAEGVQEPDCSPVSDPPSDLPLPPSSVILLSAEDDLADTIRPRLEALGADCEKVSAIRAVAQPVAGGEGRREFDLYRDLSRLGRILEQLPDCRLIVVDPISAYLGRSIENINADVRSLLTPLVMLATEHRVAVVAVTHLRKRGGTAMQRSMGSTAFVAAARTAWVVGFDPRVPERRLLLPLKNNLASRATGLAFTINSSGPDGAGVVCWSNEAITHNADEVLGMSRRRCERASPEREEAVCWLHEFLLGGPQPASEARAAAEANGFSYATLRRAFRELGGQANRVGQGVPANWTWQLPPESAVA